MFIAKYFPIITLIVIALNVLVWWVRGRQSYKANPELRRSFKKIISWVIGYAAFICILFQVELLVGQHETIFDLLRKGPIGVFGLIGAGLTFLMSPLLGLYVYVFDGADELSQHPGLLSHKETLIPGRLIWLATPVLIFVAHSAFLVQYLRFVGT